MGFGLAGGLLATGVVLVVGAIGLEYLGCRHGATARFLARSDAFLVQLGRWMAQEPFVEVEHRARFWFYRLVQQALQTLQRSLRDWNRRIDRKLRTMAAPAVKPARQSRLASLLSHHPSEPQE